MPQPTSSMRDSLDEPPLDPVSVESTAAPKSKRVRTGCLTCRERHLKCDEARPICENCRKSDRECKRGVRLNFTDIKVFNPSSTPPRGPDWSVRFSDESSETQNLYLGGPYEYAPVQQSSAPQQEKPTHLVPQQQPQPDYMNNVINLQNSPYQLPPLVHTSVSPAFSSSHKPDLNRESSYPEIGHRNTSHVGSLRGASTSLERGSEYLADPERVLFMQVFVEEVAIWMDSMDSDKHFSRLLPFSALEDSMLLNAFLACGARHMTLVNAGYPEDKALHYYDTATSQLLEALRNPDRDIELCASCAVILNVYEVMSERAMQRMTHIAGARALIKECGWNAKSIGIGRACFWLNIGMELLSCLHFSWRVAWDPDQWGLDNNWGYEPPAHHGNEELWVHRIVYVTAKVANFRASTPHFTHFKDPTGQLQQERVARRVQEWNALKELCDSWHRCIPRTMHPIARVASQETTKRSPFPEVWLLGRATTMGRLFYHTVLTLLATMHPARSVDSDEELQSMRIHNAQQICGIVAHVKDRGVASAAIRILAIAAENLVDRIEQEAVLRVFDKIQSETGWKIAFLHPELMEKWGWQVNMPISPHSTSGMSTGSLSGQGSLFATNSSNSHNGNGSFSTDLPVPIPLQAQTRPKRPPPGIMNPLYSQADFNLPNHPYQGSYTPPNQTLMKGMWH